MPADWQHPKNPLGRYCPLFDGFNEDVSEWQEGKAKWAEGLKSDYNGGWIPIPERYRGQSFEEFYGPCPNQEYYMPDFPPEQRTHWQMYEDTTEGTPISPVMESPEQLARWLADNNASAFGRDTASCDQWLRMILAGSAPSMIMTEGKLMSGVEALSAVRVEDREVPFLKG